LLLHPDGRSDAVTVGAGAPSATADDHGARTPHAAGAGTDYREDGLAARIQQLLARSETAPGLRATGPAQSEGAPPADGPLPSPSGEACPPLADGTPLATDRGGFHGAPVDVLVYPLPGRPGFVDVYLRSPDCGPVLLHQAVPSH
ncbi:hypothetical protein BU198_17025, partial [Streptomyces sp. CBMA156]|nr:hypothetical protein [Streptomyces sp. CBMA156]